MSDLSATESSVGGDGRGKGKGVDQTMSPVGGVEGERVS
jgi:hypothetical protein